MSISNRTRINRENAKKSTGPTSESGKLRASQNARTHGLTAAVIPPSLRAPNPDTAENTQEHDEFQTLLDLYVDDYHPANQEEFDLTRTLASQQWQLRRADAYIENFSRDLHSKDPLLVSKVLENFTKQQARVQRVYNQTLTLLKDLRAERLDALQREVNNATRLYKHMIEKKEERAGTWQPADDGFDFSLDAVKLNMKLWDVQWAANRAFEPPEVIFKIWNSRTGEIYLDNQILKAQIKANKEQTEREMKEREEAREKEKEFQAAEREKAARLTQETRDRLDRIQNRG